MIESITLPLDKFDIKAFISEYQKFVMKWSEQDSVEHFILGIDSYDDDPENFLDDEDDEHLAIMKVLTEGRKKVFFMLHEPCADYTFTAIDGNTYDSDDLDINLEDGYGFLVEIEGGKISLHPTLYDGSSGRRTSLTIQGMCSILEEPMKEFVNRFIRN